MTTTLTINFTASEGEVVLDGTKVFGAPSELARQGDFRRREPIAFAAAQEYLTNATTTGVITVSAAPDG